MDEIIKFLFCIFIVVGISIILYVYFPIIKNIKTKKETDMNKQNPSILIEKIINEKDVVEIAKEFVSLIRCSYVLVHTMVNEGNKYNDKLQTKLFCESLKPEVLNSLNSLEGKYE